MADPTTTRTGIPFPVGSDNVNAGPAEMENMALAVDALWGLEFTDILQGAGVAGYSSNVNASGPTINSSTGVLTVTLNADVGWAYVSGTLTRFALPTAGTPLTPSTLPASSAQFVCVGIYAAPSGIWGSTGVLSQACGTAQASQAAALANGPSTPSGTIAMQFVVVTKSGANFVISTTADERTYIMTLGAGGGDVSGRLGAVTINPFAVTQGKLSAAVQSQLVASQVAIQPTTTSGLTNASPAVPASSCSLSVTVTSTQSVMITGRAVIDKTGGLGNVFAGLLLDGGLLTSWTGGGVDVGGTGGTSPVISVLFTTSSTSPGVLIGGVSGAGDWISMSTGMSMGTPIHVLLAAGNHTFTWAFWCDASGSQATYTVANQALAVQTF